MRDPREGLSRLQAFRSKFEGLLASARKKAPGVSVAPAQRPTRLREVTGFGANPGNLRMFGYAPEHLPPMAPLVIALHGCTQTADDYDHGTGWWSLADSLGFAVVYPQQHPPIIRRIVSRGFCQATSHVATARPFRSGRWSTAPLRNLVLTSAKYS